MSEAIQPQPAPWNKGKPIGQKSPLKLKEVWATRIRLQLAGRLRDFALFNRMEAIGTAALTEYPDAHYEAPCPTRSRESP